MPPTFHGSAMAPELEVAGVDLLGFERGPLVLEVIPSQRLEGLETSKVVDVAGEMIDFMLSHVDDPEG